ncbi:unnamed protein product [Durusdinium trenchii]|uniref:Leucine-rich repeat and guanylate kinase domain-containing protein n=2 Tax=Durusdinium trenchii TaxID=1381693 RepID=A0ABP0KJG4_9DINO
MMALPPGSQPPCLDLVPSLDLLASDHSEDDGNGDEVVPEPTNAELLNAIRSFWSSMNEKMETLNRRIASLGGPMDRRQSMTSVASDNSSQPVKSTSAKKSQALKSAAMQALEMDISKIVPFRTVQRRGTTGSPNITDSATTGRFRDKKQRQKPKDVTNVTVRVVPLPDLPRKDLSSEVDEDQIHGAFAAKGAASQPEGREAKTAGSSMRACGERGSSLPRGSSSASVEKPPSSQSSTAKRLTGQNLRVEGIDMNEASMEPRSSGERMASLPRANSSASGERADRAASAPNSPPSQAVGMRHERSDSQPGPNHRTQSIQSSGGGSVRARRSSVDLQRAVSRGNLTEVFKVRESQLTADLKPSSARPPSPRDPSGASGDGSIESHSPTKPVSLLEQLDVPAVQEHSHEDEEEDVEAPRSWWRHLSPLQTFVSGHLSKALGLVPILDGTGPFRYRQRVSMLYHWLVISYLLYGIVTVSYELSLCHFDSGMQPEICDASWPPLAVDLFLMLGSCLVLMSLGGFWNYADTTKLVAQSAEELMSYCEQNSLDEAWKSWSCSDALWALLTWVVLLIGRFGLYGWAVWKGEEQLDLSVVTFASKFSISTGVLIFACFWQVRTSHAMALIVNAWSACLLMGVCSCMESRNTWRRVSGLFRKTSRTFERCCGALGLIIVGLVFSALYDLRQGRGEEVLASVSVAVIIPGVLWTHACTTTACNRLPSLVTLCEGSDEDEDEEYTGLAMFLSLSECGFFVWDTCLTVGLVQKFLYFTAAMAGTIGFQTGALNFKS